MSPEEYEAAIATLEQENKYMRARMDRLEDEARRLEEEVFVLMRQLDTLRQESGK